LVCYVKVVVAPQGFFDFLFGIPANIVTIPCNEIKNIENEDTY